MGFPVTHFWQYGVYAAYPLLLILCTIERLIIDSNPREAALTRLTPGDASVLDRCWSGELVVLQGFARKLGLDSLISPAIRAAVRRVAGQDAAVALDASGYASIHHVLTSGQLRKVTQRAEWNLARVAPELSRRTYALGLGVESPIWVMRQPLLRFQIPFDASRTRDGNDPAFSGKYALGRFNALRPHRDSWFAEPADCINVWIALTPVVQGNGMSFYPDTDGKPLRFRANQGVVRDQAVGVPLNIELERGDAIVFHADKLHASELNRTDQTRSVLSLKVGAADPGLSAREPWRYLRIRPNDPFSRARLHPAYSIATRKLSAAKAMLASHRWSSKDSVPADSAHDPSSTLPLSMRSDLTLEELSAGQPVAVSQSSCVARTSSGEVFSFRRFCPHQGADLSLGQVVDDRVVCPWHNLPFDLFTGRSPCTSLAGLNPKRCEVRGGLVRLGFGTCATVGVDDG